jgi:hypothetical protein
MSRLGLLVTMVGVTAGAAGSPGPYSPWSYGPSTNADFFPIAVWLQNPSRAGEYREAGFNTYVGLWRGPTETHLADLKAAGMRVICSQNEVGRRHLDNPTIIGWMHGDEPDNAQSLGSGKGYGPPIPPERIIGDYERLRQRDPTRPILLNLGQGVAWDDWHGRGVRTRHPEDYLEYVKGGDIVSFDIYPAVHDHPEVSGNLWFVARGVERLVEWTDNRKVIWNCIECTRIQNPTRKPTPQEVRAEVWMSIVRGSRGLIYFVHEWEPRFNEAALLDDAEMLDAVTAINRQILELAPVLNSPAQPDLVKLIGPDAEHPVATTCHVHGGATYVFSVNLRPAAASHAFELSQATKALSVKVLGENRNLPLQANRFEDRFPPWGVHLYQVDAK